MSNPFDSYNNKRLPSLPSLEEHDASSPGSVKKLFDTGLARFRRKITGTRADINTDLSKANQMSRSQASAPKTLGVQSETGSHQNTSQGRQGASASSTMKVNPTEGNAKPTGGRNINQTRRETPPSSAPANAIVPDPYRSPSKPERQTNSTPVPVPTRRYLRENNIPAPAPMQASFTTPKVTFDDVDSSGEANSEATSERDSKPKDYVRGYGGLNPTRDGTYGTVGEAQFVEGNAIHRVASCAGIIENAEGPPSVTEEQHPPRSTNTTPNRNSYTDENTMLQPLAYTPSAYGGVWENDPHVGGTLPPFSPMPPNFHHNSDESRVRPQDSHETFPMQAGDSYAPAGYVGDFAPSSHSSNSWAPMHGQSNMPFHARVPPLFSHGPANNAVPPPPQTYRDYQPPSGPIPPELHMVELNIHHHIDTCFASLSRLVTDKIDQNSDRLIRGFENIETKFDKSLKGIKDGIKNVPEAIQDLQGHIRKLQDGDERTADSLQHVQAKADKISSEVENIGSSLEKLRVGVTSSTTKSESYENALTGMEQKVHELVGKIDRLGEHTASNRHPIGISPRRSQSTANHSPTSTEQRQQFHSGNNYSSMGARNSNASSRGRRSNTATGGNTSAISDGRSSRREYFAEIGHSMGEAPDLRQHPAFFHAQHNTGYDANGQPMGMGPDGTAYQMSAFAGRDPSGWYNQAYGN